MPKSNVDKLFLESGTSDWDSFLERLEATMTSRQFATWFSDVKLIGIEENQLVLGFPSKLFVDYVSCHHINKLKKALIGWVDGPSELKLECVEGFVEKTTPFRQSPSPQGSKPVAQLQESPQEKKANRLIDHYQFSSFVPSGGFQMAYTIAKEVAKNPGQTDLNPLIIYGNTGMGKTHLANALGNYCVDYGTAPKALYITSEQFLVEFVEMVRAHKSRPKSQYYNPEKISSDYLMGMSKKWLDCDVLIVDDIQFFVGKKETQDHFCQILNALTSMKKQVVVTCDQNPESFHETYSKPSSKVLDPRMIHKFRSGMTVEVDGLTPNVREEIFRKKIQEARRAGYVNDEVIRYLSDIPLENVRELEGVLNKLFAYKELMKKDLTIEMARVVLGDTTRNFQKPRSIVSIIDAVSEHMGVPVEMIKSHSRIRKALLPRKIAMYLSRELTDNSMYTIGLHFSRNYATVIHSLKTLVKLMERDPEISTLVREIKERILNP